MTSWPRIDWRNLSNGDVQDRLMQTLWKWEGTAYHLGMQECQVGVDCVRFVCAIADEMQGTTTEVPKMMGDHSMHDPEGARAVFKFLMREFDARRVETTTLEPGDVVVCGPEGGGPGHAMIAGSGMLYHATGRRVQTARFSPQVGHPVFHCILRIPDKETRWALQ
jgi:cell wall-associated NlpC family hydrolase